MAIFFQSFFFLLLTTRFFSETLNLIPKGIDLLDMVVIPLFIPILIALLAMRSKIYGQYDHHLHNTITKFTGYYIAICIISYLMNYSRVNLPPALLYMFGMLEGPILFLILNRIVKDKMKFGIKMSRFINFMVIVEFCAVLFVNIPMFIDSGNPDVVSGTFGNNSYQFTVFLIIIGGYFLGKFQSATNWVSKFYGILIQIFVIGTFVLLQYRSAVPAFLLTYAVVLGLLYGKKFIRLFVVAGIISMMIYGAFTFVSNQNYKLRYDDLIDVAKDPTAATGYGKVVAYRNTFTMFSEHPQMILFGSGPGNFVSRANYTFTIELNDNISKGVGFIIRKIFGNNDYSSDVFRMYIEQLYYMEALYGSVQLNNPNSSVLAPLAETGLLGLIVIGVLYFTLGIKSSEYFQYARKTADKNLLPLATSLLMGVLFLLLLTPLDNYLEIGRITLFIWFLFWVVSSIASFKKYETKNQILNWYIEKEKHKDLHENEQE